MSETMPMGDPYRHGAKATAEQIVRMTQHLDGVTVHSGGKEIGGGSDSRLPYFELPSDSVKITNPGETARITTEHTGATLWGSKEEGSSRAGYPVTKSENTTIKATPGVGEGSIVAERLTKKALSLSSRQSSTLKQQEK